MDNLIRHDEVPFITGHMQDARMVGEEGVGFIVADGSFIPMKNDSARPGDTWEISKAQTEEWLKSTSGSRDVVAIVHSHPRGTAVPSAVDLSTAEVLCEFGVQFYLWVWTDKWSAYQYDETGEVREIPLIHTP